MQRLAFQERTLSPGYAGAEALGISTTRRDSGLANGDTLLAEAPFEQELEASRRLRLAAEQLAASEGRREADAARNVASLAVLRGDLSKAVRYFQMALEANPEDLDAALQLGNAWISVGELDQAGTVFAALIQQAKAAQNPRLEGCGLNGRGDVLVAQGDGPGALAAYQAGLAIREGLAKRDSANTGWQVDLAASCARLGTLDSLVPMQQRKEYLSRGLNLLTTLKQAGRLHANQDWTGWLDNALRSLN